MAYLCQSPWRVATAEASGYAQFFAGEVDFFSLGTALGHFKDAGKNKHVH